MAGTKFINEHCSSSSIPFMLAMMIITIFTVSIVPSRCCLDDQKAVLLQFASLFLGAAGNYSVLHPDAGFGPNTSVSCCEWQGVVCDSHNRLVTELHLWGFILQSEWETGVSSDVLNPLFRLTSLQFLDLSDNAIRGEIPPGIGNLTRLQYLDMSDNRFKGPMPPQLFTLTHLKTLRLGFSKSSKFTKAGNSLEGKIPREIGNLTDLVELDLNGNKLNGDIPASLVQLNKLALLKLNDNLLSGEIPTWLFESSSMKYLSLGNNKLTLTSEKQMAPKSKFEELSLISCNISSHGIPIWLANQTNLKFLDLSSNKIAGTFPNWLAQMSIQSLLLADNLLQGTLPPALSLNTCLKDLDLSKNNFEGKLFPDRDINKTEQYEYFSLVLSDNEFIGSPGYILNMTWLSWLDLSRNQLSGEPFEFLCQDSSRCPDYINLSNNIFHGKIFISLDRVGFLSILELSYNSFSEIYLSQNVSSLSVLDLRDNRISGEIPTFFTQIPHLRILSLGNNLLQGSIPATLSNLRSLQILDLSGNKLRGGVPTNLGTLTGMIDARADSAIMFFDLFNELGYTSFDMFTYNSIPWLEVVWKNHHQGIANQHLGLYTFLDLSNNQLSGEIPNSLGNLKSLKVLNFSHNSLSGQIPASFGDITDLESLDLSHNNLSGEIPESMGQLLQITDLQLSDNNLSGRIPTGPQMDRMNNPDSYTNNNADLCGMQIGKPCDEVAAAPTQEARTEEGIESEEGSWFSWMTAGIGYPAGFVTTVLGMYSIGYFHHVPMLQRRRRMMRRRAIRF